MAVNQVQIRRDSYANLYAATPNDGEIAYDQGNKRLTIGDGSKLGGHPIPSWQDVQGQTFTAGTTTGSANAQVLTPGVQYQPTAYAANQRFQFIAGYTNTGTTTLTVTALTAKTIKKVVSGALANLAAGDITAGLPYDVMYDGTDFVMMNSGVGSLGSAAAGDYIAHEITVYDARYSWDNGVTNFEDFGATFNFSGVGAVYTKVAEIIAPRDGTYRVRVGVYQSQVTAYVKAYLNGSPAGTELAGTTDTAVYQNDDIGVTKGDLIQLYFKESTGDAEYAQIAIMEAAPLNPADLYTLYTGWNI